jgi:RNA polymerase-binding transcription factor DksA
MADTIDQAQAREQMDRDLMLAEHHRRAAAAHALDGTPVLDGLCIDCDEPIEPQRIAVLRVTSRCASCAEDFERRMAMQGRRP